MPKVVRSKKGVNWYSNKILDISKDGKRIAFLSKRANATNIFIKDIDKAGASVQRTNRSAVQDFSFSPDGKSIAFTEAIGQTNSVFQTDANNGFVCRQITSGAKDFGPSYSNDMTKIFFSRQETKNISIWSYDFSNNFLSSYTNGFGPYPEPGSTAIYCSRQSSDGRCEIWRVDYASGIEECIVSSQQQSFASPSLSPDNTQLVFVGSSMISEGSFVYWNTDIYVCNIDGTGLRRLTYHAADDLSPVWSKDGNYIYFISQRGSANGIANIWKMQYSKQ